MPNLQKATLAGGCFWCIEAIFRRLNGVQSVMPGYAGNGKPNPTYQEVSSQRTPYAEAVQIEFDPAVISYSKLLDVLWALIDPTTLNKQGNDIGPEYRSAVFYHDQQQKEIAEASKKALQESGKYTDPIVTSIEPFTHFYPAEQEHRDFYERNRANGYCKFIIDPKITKLYKTFNADLKEQYKTGAL